jgi:hypothetical protein
MRTASRLFRATVVAALAVSLTVCAPCLAISTASCNLGHAVASHAKTHCCCGTDCKCGPNCGSTKSQNSSEKQSTDSQSQLRDLAKSSHQAVQDFVEAGSDRPHLKGGDFLLWPLASCQQTLLAQHTFLRV